MEFRQPQVPPSVPPLVPGYGPSARPLVRPARYVSDFVVVAGLVAIFVLAMSLLGKLKTIFADFHVALPSVTRALLYLHYVYAAYYGWALVWVIPVVAPLALGQAEPRSRRRWFLAAYFLIGLLIVVMFVALIIPLASLIEGISGRK